MATYDDLGGRASRSPMSERPRVSPESVATLLGDLVGALVAIDSVNPTLVPGAPGERAITDFVARWLAARGVTVSEVASDPADEDRPSLLCHVPGTGGGESLMLYAHTDTVGVTGMSHPFDGIVQGGTLHGRGAWDMKGSLAAIMRVAAGVAARPCAGDLWLMIVADEESGSRGSEAVLRELARRGVSPAGCLVAEPSDHQLMLGHRGFATGTIVTRGRAAHTARRDEGIDAIAMMARCLVALEELDARMHSETGHPLLGHGAVVASLVRGGSELFTYPAECEAHFVWRMLPGEDRGSLTGALDAIFATLRARDPRFDATLAWQAWREPMLGDEDGALARVVASAACDVLGRAPGVCAAPWWTDAALIQGVGIPCVIFGPPGGGIHADDEWVELTGLEDFERILTNVTRSFCT